jgi:hypothetical protein
MLYYHMVASILGWLRALDFPPSSALNPAIKVLFNYYLVAILVILCHHPLGKQRRASWQCERFRDLV